jgi:hypothetical protein
MNANELPDAKLLRKKLKNGLIVDKWDLVTIIEKQEAMLRQQQAEIEALKNRNWELVSEPWGFDRHPAKTLTLTPDEIFDIWDEHTDYDGNFISDIDTFVLAILRKAQEK